MNSAKCAKAIKLSLVITDVIITLSGMIMLIAGSVIQAQINTQRLARTIGGFSTASGSIICIILGIAVLLFGLFGLFAAIKDHHRFLVLYSILMFTVFIIQFIPGVVGLSVKNSSKFGNYVSNVFQSEFVVNSTAEVERDFYQQYFRCCGWVSFSDYNKTIPDSCCKTTKCDTNTEALIFTDACGPKITSASKHVIDVACGILVTFAIFNFISIALSLMMSRQIKNGYHYQ